MHWNKFSVTKHLDANSDYQVRFKLIIKKGILNEGLAVAGGIGKPGEGGIFCFLKTVSAFSKQKRKENPP